MNPGRMVRAIIRRAKRRFLEGPQFATEDVRIGRNVRFGRNVVFKSKTVRIGDGASFRDNVTVEAEHFEIGDYGTIYDYCFFPGGKVVIGHNFWLGTACVVDGRGGTVIGNNVGIGAHSQLWTHMIYGDVMYGCRYHSVKTLEIEDDTWLVGHCLVSPVKIKARSLAMLGSLITKDMEADRTYAGVPARDITDKVGPQFQISSTEERLRYMQERIETFARLNKIDDILRIVKLITDSNDKGKAGTDVTVFNVANRTYIKTGTKLEHKLLRFLLPDAKFIPAS